MSDVVRQGENFDKLVIGVDDAAENLYLLQSIARAAGYTFVGLQSGQEVLALPLHVRPRLIFLDIEMPKLDGFETCRLLRRSGHLNDVPIVFLTVRNSHRDVKRCLAVGGSDFIMKPINPQKLLERLRYWTDRRASFHPPNAAGKRVTKA
jgi:CheY-like chemotaxis protein